MNEIKQQNTISAGSIFTVSTGEYSDYSVHGVFRAVMDIDPDRLAKEWLEQHPDQAGNFRFKPTEFLGQAFRSGLFEHVPSLEWHLSDYADISEMTLTGPSDFQKAI